MTRFGIPCWPSACVGFLRSRFSTPARSRSRLFLQASLLGLGIMYTTSAWRADNLLYYGVQSDSISTQASAVLRANAVFPLSSRIREATAGLIAQTPEIPPIFALGVVKNALEQAPNDPRLLYFKGVQHLRAGDKPSAEETAVRLRAQVPHWPQTEHLQKLIKETKP